MKKKLLLAALTAICICIAAYGTVAYFTAEDTATNVVTAGNIDVSLKESALAEDGETLVPFEDAIGVMPGTQASKIVQVENTGDHDAYVRVRVETQIDLPEGADLSLIGLDINTQDWVEKDGYYYYKQPLSAGAITQPLFTTVTFSKDMGNEYQNTQAKITVTAYAVQAENNGSDVLKAAGWPAE